MVDVVNSPASSIEWDYSNYDEISFEVRSDWKENNFREVVELLTDDASTEVENDGEKLIKGPRRSKRVRKPCNYRGIDEYVKIIFR